MITLNTLVKKAEQSKFYLWLLNILLHRMIPFNKPHGFRIISITTDTVTTLLPYKKYNLNHVKGLHACALATLCEYVSGLTILLHLSADQYRIILQNINIDYHYQGKMAAYTSFTLTKTEVEGSITYVLNTQDAVLKALIVNVYDEKQNHLCTGTITWQIKPWNRVKTRV